MLRRYLSDRAKIEPRRKTGTCARHQRMLSTALERARHIALLPFTSDQVQQAPQRYGSYGDRPSYNDRGGYADRGQSSSGPREAAVQPREAPAAPAAAAAGAEG